MPKYVIFNIFQVDLNNFPFVFILFLAFIPDNLYFDFIFPSVFLSRGSHPSWRSCRRHSSLPAFG